jgi:hypothetical protein
LEVWWMLGPFSPPLAFCFDNSPWNFVCMDQVNHLIWLDFFSQVLKLLCVHIWWVNVRFLWCIHFIFLCDFGV